MDFKANPIQDAPGVVVFGHTTGQSSAHATSIAGLRMLPRRVRLQAISIGSGGGTTTKTPAPGMVLALFKGISLYSRKGSGCFDGATSDYQKSYQHYR